MLALQEILAAIAMFGAVALMLVGIAYGIFRDRVVAEHHRRAMLAAWYCTQCGYDVRATPSEVCPECGAAIPPKFPRSPAR